MFSSKFNLIQILKVHSGTISEEPDQTPRYATTGLVPRCLHVSHKKDARLKWININ